MIWIDNIHDLDYYNHDTQAECYCDLLVNESDLTLQAEVAAPSNGRYEVIVQVMSADGLEVLEDATQYFKWAIFQGVNGKFYINLQANRFAPTMCSVGCFILKLTVNRIRIFTDISGSGGKVVKDSLFSKYTERYCVDNCCLVPANIDIVVGDTEGEYDALDYDNNEYFAS